MSVGFVFIFPSWIEGMHKNYGRSSLVKDLYFQDANDSKWYNLRPDTIVKSPKFLWKPNSKVCGGGKSRGKSWLVIIPALTINIRCSLYP